MPSLLATQAHTHTRGCTHARARAHTHTHTCIIRTHKQTLPHIMSATRADTVNRPTPPHNSIPASRPASRPIPPPHPCAHPRCSGAAVAAEIPSQRAGVSAAAQVCGRTEPGLSASGRRGPTPCWWITGISSHRCEIWVQYNSRPCDQCLAASVQSLAVTSLVAALVAC